MKNPYALLSSFLVFSTKFKGNTKTYLGWVKRYHDKIQLQGILVSLNLYQFCNTNFKNTQFYIRSVKWTILGQPPQTDLGHSYGTFFFQQLWKKIYKHMEHSGTSYQEFLFNYKKIFYQKWKIFFVITKKIFSQK